MKLKMCTLIPDLDVVMIVICERISRYALKSVLPHALTATFADCRAWKPPCSPFFRLGIPQTILGYKCRASCASAYHSLKPFKPFFQFAASHCRVGHSFYGHFRKEHGVEDVRSPPRAAADCGRCDPGW